MADHNPQHGRRPHFHRGRRGPDRRGGERRLPPRERESDTASRETRETKEPRDSGNVDAVILDLLMPRMNGFEVIPKLRTKHPEIAIIAYTAVAGDFVRNEMTRLRIPLVLKSGAFNRLDSVLRELSAPAHD